MTKLNTYLFFDGQCEKAMRFYAKSLGGEVVMMLKNGDMAPENQMPGADPDLIMHARIAIGDQVLMASDAPKDRYHKTQGVAVSVLVDTPADARRVFDALAQGGQIHMPLEKTFWAESFGMLVDQFGISWMVNCENAAQKAA